MKRSTREDPSVSQVSPRKTGRYGTLTAFLSSQEPVMRIAAQALVVAYSCVTLPSFAQDTNSYNGNWKVVGSVPGSGSYQADLRIEGDAGSWQALVTNRDDPCVGRKVPISVLSATSEELTFRIKMSEALAGCQDSTAKLKRVDDSTLKGTRGRQELTATRK